MRITTTIALAILIASCEAPAPEGDMADKIAERDSLKAQVSEMNVRIAEINKTIAENEEGFEKALTLVEAKAVEPKRFQHFFQIYGEVETDKNVLLYPEMSGLITNIRVSEGDKVSKGQVLASIDSQIIQNQIHEMETAYDLAKTTFEKQERLWKKKIGSEMQYLQAKNQKESLESSMATLNSQLSKAQVRAPFSGVVDDIMPRTGEMATPQMAMMRIVNLDRMYIKSDVSEQHLRAVKEGTPVTVDFPDMDKSIETEVSESSKFINPENRSFSVRVDLPRNNADLRPNQMAHMKINDYSHDNTLVLSASIVMQTPSGEDFVYVLAEEEGEMIARRKIVTTGMEYEGEVEIKEGLQQGDRVIVKGGQSVRDGQRVRTS